MYFKETSVALYTLVRKEVVRFLRIWTQTLLPPAITQTLYFIIFGTFIGSQLRDIEGISYMAFIVPGLIMMAVINASYSNVVASFFGSKFQRNVEELMVSPVPTWVIIAGYSVGSVLRGILVGLIVFVISWFFTTPDIYNFGVIALFILLTSLLFSLGGLINGLFARKFDDINIFPVFILTPLTYFGGVFYSIDMLPEFWQIVSKFNPIVYMVDGFRYGFHGFSDFNVWLSLGVLAVFVLLLGGINYYLFDRGIGIRN
ncbi:ABC transporter permease [Candidatus Peregrinibacteria bacterium]|nr:ABC transporter permease [Candidatus Peregrinibacteria bacterium]